MTKQQTQTINKTQLAAHYDVSVKTLNKWALLLTDKKDCPFNMEEYNQMRLLPPKWVDYIKAKLG